MEIQRIGWAVTAFADHVRLGKDAEQTIDIVMRSWKEIDRVMRTIIGKGGIDALFHRSIEITAVAYPWLAAASSDAQSVMDLDALRATLLKQETGHFAAASDALLLHFYQLLTNLIGLSLTDRLLRPVLDPLLNSAAAKDI